MWYCIYNSYCYEMQALQSYDNFEQYYFFGIADIDKRFFICWNSL